MFVLQVLNSASEWELISYAFKSEAEAIAFYNAELSMFEDYSVTELETM